MTSERWRHINTLLQEALDRSPIERSAFLDEACANDEATHREVQSLISLQQKAESFLEVPALEAAAELFADDQAESLIGQLIGQYKIESLLGSGGMGKVYLAEDTKLDRKVAIKFLPIELETDDLARRRQIREAKAAAKLDHQNICAIHEVAEDASRSFIVMQYVDGETLASRIERGAIKLRESVDVALQVADALSIAHSHGVIHRDIKPQNIMITPRGQVKVLDFGLAKVVRDGMQQEPQNRETPLSVSGVIVGTVPYMSPEQAKGMSVDARSDLFSLGVVLYECVAGKPAFAGNTPMEICAQVIHVDPPPPSRFNPKIPPQLDRVILKTLAKRSDARYQSADQLIEYLRRARDSFNIDDDTETKPIPTPSPNPPTVWSVLLKFARRFALRRRVLVPAVLAALVAMGIWIKWPPIPHRPSDEALRWYEHGTIALHDGTYFKASKALEHAIQLDDKFVLAHARLAQAWSELDYIDRAKDELLRVSSPGPNHSLGLTESLYVQAVTSTVLREFSLAVASYEEIARQTAESERASVYVDLGRAYENNDQLEDARKNYLEATRLAPSNAAAFLRLGVLYGRQQNLALALEAFQQAEALYQALSNHEGATEVVYQRGFLFNLNKRREARTELEKALEMTRTTGNQHQAIRAMLVLSSIYVAEGSSAEAEQQATQAIELARTNGMENQATEGLIWLGNSFLKRGEYDDAEKYYQLALDLARRDHGRKNEAWARMQLGSLRIQQRNVDEALRYIHEALPFYVDGHYHKWLMQIGTLLGRAYVYKGDYEAALNSFRSQLEEASKVGDMSQIALSQSEIGSVLAIQERYVDAIENFAESYKINKVLSAEVSAGWALVHRGTVQWQLGHFEEAKAALDEASSLAVRSEGSYRELLANVKIVNASLELSLQHFSVCRSESLQAINLARAQYPDVAVQARSTLGLLLARSSATRAGRALCQAAVNMATSSTGDPQLINRASLSYAETLLISGDAPRALETALRVKTNFAAFGQHESEWRAWLIAALAERQMIDAAAAREYAAQASDRLSNLAQKWGNKAYDSYVARPDIQHSLNQLRQLTQ